MPASHATLISRIKKPGLLALGVAILIFALTSFWLGLQSPMSDTGAISLGAALLGGLLLIVRSFGGDPHAPGPDSSGKED